MAKRQREWAARKFEHLRIQLGGKCTNCGSANNLEFDCIAPQGHDHHRVEKSVRATFYVRQARAGNLQLLCGACHSHKTRADNAAAVTTGSQI